MNEKVLHFIWKYQLFSSGNLTTTQQESLVIVDAGKSNQNSGPDFLNSSIRIDDQLWVGNVEIHQKSSDWYAHNHHFDEHYKAVILHVVWEHDCEVFNPHHQKIPTFELSKFVQSDFLKRYTDFNLNNPKWILCENELKNISRFTFQYWIEVLFIERLERKSIEIDHLLMNAKNDWEQVLWTLLAKNFGAKINSDAFLQLALSIDYAIIRKEKNNLTVFESLLFGQAGFLNEDLEDAYYQILQQEYQFLISKYGLKPILIGSFHFFRLRPLNFPTVRIAQLAGLMCRNDSLFSNLMKASTKETIYSIFKSKTSAYWDVHFTFGKTSKTVQKNITKNFMDTLIINTVIPLKFAYQQQKGGVDMDALWELMQSIKAEKNKIIQRFSEFGYIANNAIQTQALVQLKEEYCAKHRCLDCLIGNEILKK